MMFSCLDSGLNLECSLKDTTTFIPDVRYGRVVKVYDGDTITIGTRLYPIRKNQPIYRFSVRLNGIDTPEIKGSGPEEHNVAVKARDWLSSKIMGRLVALHDVKFEKYGRLLATIYLVHDRHKWLNYLIKPSLEEISLNQQMIDNRFAVRYDGGTKSQIDWVGYHENGDTVEIEFSQI